MIHIEGMGVLGSLLARALHDRGAAFTWHDIEHPYAAWPACTGIAYPGGDPNDGRGLALWDDLIHRGIYSPQEVLRVPYLYAHKSPPHKAKWKPMAEFGVGEKGLRQAPLSAVAVNVPAMVQATRDRFARLRLEEAPPTAPQSIRVVCHTTPLTGDGYLWGWARKVELTLPRQLQRLRDAHGAIPALYAKAHRYDLTYAYPIPGTPCHWAGSQLLMQRDPKVRDATQAFETWQTNARRLFGVEVAGDAGLFQGWRPRSRNGSTTAWDEPFRPPDDAHTWLMPALPTSGVRHGPLVIAALLRKLAVIRAIEPTDADLR